MVMKGKEIKLISGYFKVRPIGMNSYKLYVKNKELKGSFKIVSHDHDEWTYKRIE